MNEYIEMHGQQNIKICTRNLFENFDNFVFSFMKSVLLPAYLN